MAGHFTAPDALTLYIAPGSSSMAPHIALREVGAVFEVRSLFFALKQNRDPAYPAINPQGKVPALLVAGRALTEVAGILFYIARRFSEADLLPVNDPEAEAQVVSWMSFLASTVHPARRQGLAHARAVYALVEERLGGRDGVVGDRMSIADIHLFRLFWRFRGSALSTATEFAGLTGHHDRMMARQAVRDTCEAEQAMGYERPA